MFNIILVYPESYTFQAVSVNGSSPLGLCSSVVTTTTTWNGEATTCNTPTSSVLFDGNIPTLSGLEGGWWASQLLTLYKTDPTRAEMAFDFTDTLGYAGIGRVEMVIFNCPEWGIGVRSIQLFGHTRTSFFSDSLGFQRISDTTSCDSLLRVCLMVPPRSVRLPVLSMEFVLLSQSLQWVHLAEVTFYGIGGYCRPDTVFTTQPPATSNATLA